MQTAEHLNTKLQSSSIEGIGSRSEVEAFKTQNPAIDARKSSSNFMEIVNNVFKGPAHERFRALVEDIDLTVNRLNKPSVGRPMETMQASLNSVRTQMTKIIVAIDTTEKSDTRLPSVLGAHAEMERTAKAFAAIEQHKRNEAEKQRVLAKEMFPENGALQTLRSILIAPTATSAKSRLALG